MNFKPLQPFHQHSDSSLDGAATVEQIIKRNKELGATHVTLTEHGHMCSAMELYSRSKKLGMKPILGIEAYLLNPFHDEYVEIYRKAHHEGLISLRAKQPEAIEKELQRKAMNHYLHITIHFKDEWAYKYFCGLSKAMWNRAVQKYDELKPMITLEELKGAAGHITIGSSCMRGPAAYFLLPSRDGIIKPDPARAEYMFNVMREIAGPDSFFSEIFPHAITHDWVRPEKAVEAKDIEKTITLEDGTEKVVIEHIPAKPFKPGYFKANECTCDFPDGDMQKPLNRFMLELSEKYNVPALISLDSHFARPEQKMIQSARLGNGQDAWNFYNSYHIMSSDEAAAHLQSTLGLSDKKIEEMIDNSYQWASLFDNFKIPTNKDRWILDGDSDKFLSNLKGTIDKWGRMDYGNPEMMDRLKKEVQVLAFNGKINLLSYFATVEDMANYCRDNGILMNVRGSAGGSLLLYLIGVSSVNPLKHGLSFERFLTDGRIKTNAIPDADLDLSDQEGMVKYLTEKYGDKVCRLSTEMLLRIKTSIKDVERSMLGGVRPETEALTKKLPSTPQGTNDHDFVFGYTDDIGVHHPGLFETNLMLKKYAEDNPKLWEVISETLGIQRNRSTHACGFIIADKPVTEYMPLIKVNDEWTTGYSPKWVEEAGGVKFDLLGLNTLRDIQLCLKSIEERIGTKIDPFDLPYDKKCFDEFAKGNTETVFQFDTVTVRPYAMSVCPKSIEDLSSLTSLCRPGTLDAPSGCKDYNDRELTLAEVYVKRAKGEMPVEFIHPELEHITGETYAVQLYQEQTLKIFRDIGGMSDEEAEAARRGIGKKDEKVLREATNRLRESALTKGWTEEQINLLVDQIMASARYSFNKSHATSYSYVAYACMYLKVNYPLDWWKATLSNASKDEVTSKFWRYVKDIVVMPDINQSSSNFVIKNDKLMAPMSILHGVGEKAFQQLTKHAPYSSLEQFVEVHLTKRPASNRSAVNVGITRKLIAAGVLDSLFPPDTITVDKMMILEQVRSRVTGKKIESVPEEYTMITSLGQYLLKKQLIGIYSEDLRELILPKRGGIKRPFNGYSDMFMWFTQDNKIVLDGPMIDWIKNACSSGNPHKAYGLIDRLVDTKDKQPIVHTDDNERNFCAVGYVVYEKAFQYKNKSKQATTAVIDINGVFVEETLWPGYDDSSAPTGFKDLPVLVHYKLNHKGCKMTELLPYFTKENISSYNME